MTTAYISLDSGGTRSIGSVDIDGDGIQDKFFQGPDIISGTTPVSEYVPALRRILARADFAYEHLMAERGVEVAKAYLFIAAAGFAAGTKDAFADALGEVVPDYFGGKVVTAGASNDGTALLLGYDSDAIVIAGTGSTVLLRDSNGQIKNTGGHDWVGCDYGSGFWIGLKGIRQAGRDFENRRQMSSLLERFREEYTQGSDEPERMVDALRILARADSGMKGQVARFAEAVCKAATHGNEEAQDIVKEEAEDLANMTANALRRSLGVKLFEGIDVVLSGSVLSNTFYRRIFEEHVALRLTNEEQGQANINWRSVENGGHAVYELAKRMETEPEFATRVRPRSLAPSIIFF